MIADSPKSIDDGQAQRSTPAPSDADGAEHSFPVVGIGASAGGYEAFAQLLENLPAEPEMAFVLVQHLDPKHASSLTELLAKSSKMPVRQVTSGTQVQVNHVYVIPPNSDLVIRQNLLQLSPRLERAVPHMPVDYFLRSLAEDRKSQAIGVILSGTGSDGTLGLRAIKAEGGITFAQDKSAKYDGMPTSAILSGCVDFVQPPREIAEALVQIGAHPYLNHAPPHEADGQRPEDGMLELFHILKKASGVDFSNYKHGTLQRRIQRRMVVHRLEKLNDYVKLLRDNKTEAESLYHDMLIQVTSFFREPEVFEGLKKFVFPPLLKERDPASPVRIWVPGCSSGEEVYSTAIALLECLGDNPNNMPIKIFATDIDDNAVNQARQGKYLENIATDISPERLRRFFSRVDGGYQISKSIRDLCVFARQDVTRDPPFSSLDLISCRNVLIYLGPVLQKRVLPIFHYALKSGGYLLLGTSETIGGFNDLFRPVEPKHRIYARKETAQRTAFYFDTPDLHAGEAHSAGSAGVHELTALEIQREADRLVLSKYAPAGVVVTENFDILQFRGQTGAYLEPAPGAAAFNLLKMGREGLLLPLRSLMDQAKQAKHPVRQGNVRVKCNGGYREINLVVSPFKPVTSKARLFVVLFEDPQLQHTPPAPESRPSETVKPKPEPAREQAKEFERLAEEQSGTRAYLNSIIEEREASNEELKAANEEIVSSNEELRSTNEELQTAKEELQATNEELGTVNDELRHRNEEASRLNDDLRVLLESIQIPIVMLGRSLNIRRFTPSAARLLNLIPTDVGRPIGNIKPRLVVSDFEELVNRVIDSLQCLERDVQDVDGRWHQLAIRPYKTSTNQIDGAVITMVDIDLLKTSEERFRAAEARLRAILDTAAEGIIIMDDQGTIQDFNHAAETIFGYAAEEIIGKNANILLGGLKAGERSGYLTKIVGARRELEGRHKNGSTVTLDVHVSEVSDGKTLYTAIVRDVSQLKQAQERMLQAERLASIGKMSAGLAHESRNALQRAHACVEMLRREIKDQGKAVELLDRIQDAQNRLLQLYEETRSFAAPINLNRRLTDLSEVVRSAWDSLSEVRKGRKAKLTSKPGKLDVKCEVDAAQIEQVVRNTLENALQASPDPCKIDVSWSEANLKGEPAVQMAIHNNGPALTPQELQQMFEEFFTTKTHGTGLGLTIARRIVEAHGGRIEANPNMKEGVEILVTLPRGM